MSRLLELGEEYEGPGVATSNPVARITSPPLSIYTSVFEFGTVSR